MKVPGKCLLRGQPTSTMLYMIQVLRTHYNVRSSVGKRNLNNSHHWCKYKTEQQKQNKLTQFKTADINVPAYWKHFKSNLFSSVAWNNKQKEWIQGYYKSENWTQTKKRSLSVRSSFTEWNRSKSGITLPWSAMCCKDNGAHHQSGHHVTPTAGPETAADKTRISIPLPLGRNELVSKKRKLCLPIYFTNSHVWTWQPCVLCTSLTDLKLGIRYHSRSVASFSVRNMLTEYKRVFVLPHVWGISRVYKTCTKRDLSNVILLPTRVLHLNIRTA